MNKFLILTYIFSCFTFINSAISQTPLNPKEPKYIIVKGIFDKLTSSFANGLNEPTLLIAKKGKMKYGAKFESEPIPRIIIDEELIDACNTLGNSKNSAIALILGHELAHYYRRDNYYTNLGFAENKTAYDKRQLEAMADFEACFHAQIIGYNPNVFGKTLDLIYRLYHLPENINGYYPKEFRKNAYTEKLKELGSKVAFYEVGTGFYLNKKYIEAADLFQNLSLYFPSREIWNNLGACYLQLGFQEMEVSSQEFIFPVEFDINTRMTSGSRGILNDDKIEQAIIYFKKAILMDNDYWPAKINTASAYLSLNKYHSAIHTVEEGVNLPPDAYTILGIAHAHLQNTEKAKINFEKAAQLGANGANYNLTLFNQNQNWWLDISKHFIDMKHYVAKWFVSLNSTPKPSSTFNTIIKHNIKYNKGFFESEWKGNTFGIIKKYQDSFGNRKYEISEKGQPKKTFEYRTRNYVNTIQKEKTNSILSLTSKTGQPVSKITYGDKSTIAIFKTSIVSQKIIVFENPRKQIEKWLIIK
jgi:tetratricopeptide (TPR) repeat protein